MEKAQQNKLRALIRKAALQPGDHVLEIGSGWGSFAMEAVRSAGCRVTSHSRLVVEELEDIGIHYARTLRLWQAGTDLWPQLWFRATLLDAYCGFLTFYAWVFYRERNWRSRLLCFLLIMLLGNIAMSGYLLLRLRKLPRDAAMPQLLLR